jgi:ribosomal protein S30
MVWGGVMSERVVYFIRPVGQVGPIKIGFSVAPDVRLIRMAAGSPLPLEIVATIPGSASLERAFHETFAYAHSHFEWFHPVDDLLRGIHALQQGVTLEDAFDLTKKSGSIRKSNPKIRERFTPEFRERRGYHLRVIHHRRKMAKVSLCDPMGAEAENIFAYERTRDPLTAAERAFLDQYLGLAAD